MGTSKHRSGLTTFDTDMLMTSVHYSYHIRA